jgi:hypothetical protein
LLTLPRDSFDKLIVLEDKPSYLDYLKVTGHSFSWRIYARPPALRSLCLTRCLLYVAIGRGR